MPSVELLEDARIAAFDQAASTTLAVKGDTALGAPFSEFLEVNSRDQFASWWGSGHMAESPKFKAISGIPFILVSSSNGEFYLLCDGEQHSVTSPTAQKSFNWREWEALMTTCVSADEMKSLIHHAGVALSASGWVHTKSKGSLECLTCWGGTESEGRTDDCWALRLGRTMHSSQISGAEGYLPEDAPSDRISVPLIGRARVLGVLTVSAEIGEAKAVEFAQLISLHMARLTV